MSFKDEYEELTGVPMGHNAFTVVVLHWPHIRPVKYYKKKRASSKAEQTLVALMTPEERAARRRQQFLDRSAAQSAVVAAAKKKNPGFGSLLGLSQAGDERIRQHKAREAAIVAKKTASTFNVQIADQASSDRTNSINGR